MDKEINFSEDQLKVINNPISDILVSAAAGSGKSTVLVERIIKHILEDNLSISRMLVATFTNNAAASLKEKINKRIIEAIEDPSCTEENRNRLTKELSRVPSADIATLDSFFQRLVKSYFFELDINPNFKIIDGAEGRMLLDKVIDEAFSKKYEANNAEFYHFIDCYGDSKSDEKARKIISEIVLKSNSYPFPMEYIDGLESYYDIEPERFFELEYFVKIHKRLVKVCKANIDKLNACIDSVDGDEAYAPIVEILKADIKKYEAMLGTSNVLDAMKNTGVAFIKFTSVKKGMEPETREALSNARSSAKKTYESVVAAISKNPSEYENEVKHFKKITAVIAKLSKAVALEVMNIKKKYGTFEFNDIPRLCVEILYKKDENGNMIPSQYAEEIRSKYDEIMIDEYQDSNKIQELILSTISGRAKGENNIFMVGDVKQSIYRFRQAEPSIFVEKYDRYGTDGKEIVIPLKSNYRSSKFVIDTVNDVFSKVMIREIGQVDYTDPYHVLNHGADYKELENNPESKSELILYSTPKESNAAEAGAKLVACRIQNLLDSGFMVYDSEKKVNRPVTPGDICILYNSLKREHANYLYNNLIDMNIPCFKNSKTGFFKAIEVNQVMNYLEILVNPYRDVAFVSVLRSYFCGLNDEELAKLAIYSGVKKKKDFSEYYYELALRYSKDQYADPIIASKLKSFFECFDAIRLYTNLGSIRDTIQKIYDDTEYVKYCRTLNAGSQRVANLEMLLNIATKYEESASSDLNSFIEYVDNLIKYDSDTGEAFVGENNNAVQIMTYHASKGLEFPVVILPEAHKDYTKVNNEKRPEVYFADDNIYAIKYSNPEKYIVRDSFLKGYVDQIEHSEKLAECIRVLYVALTRAKHKLIMFGHLGTDDKADESYKKLLDAKISLKHDTFDYLMNCKTYLGMIAPVFLEEDKPYVEVSRVYTNVPDSDAGDSNVQEKEESEGTEEELVEEKVKASVLNNLSTKELYEKVSEYFSYEYPHSISDVPIKFSVSELKHQAIDEYEKENEGKREFTYADEEEFDPYSLVLDGSLAPKANKGALRGTLYHLLMQHIIATDIVEADEIENYIDSKISDGLFSEDMKASIKISDIVKFLKSEMAQRMRKAYKNNQLFVEQTFVLALNAKEIDEKFETDDIILVQGEIDAFFIEDGEAVLLDYKTDKVLDDGTTLVNHYKRQLEIYAEAIKRIKNVPIKDMLLYSFTLGKEIHI